MLKKIIAAKAHIAEQGTKMRKFDVAGAKLSTNSRFHSSVNGHTVSDRFKTRMRVFIQMHNADERTLGVGYKFSKGERFLEEMKSQMRG